MTKHGFGIIIVVKAVLPYNKKERRQPANQSARTVGMAQRLTRMGSIEKFGGCPTVDISKVNGGKNGSNSATEPYTMRQLYISEYIRNRLRNGKRIISDSLKVAFDFCTVPKFRSGFFKKSY